MMLLERVARFNLPGQRYFEHAKQPTEPDIFFHLLRMRDGVLPPQNLRETIDAIERTTEILTHILGPHANSPLLEQIAGDEIDEIRRSHRPYTSSHDGFVIINQSALLTPVFNATDITPQTGISIIAELLQQKKILFPALEGDKTLGPNAVYPDLFEAHLTNRILLQIDQTDPPKKAPNIHPASRVGHYRIRLRVLGGLTTQECAEDFKRQELQEQFIPDHMVDMIRTKDPFGAKKDGIRIRVPAHFDTYSRDVMATIKEHYTELDICPIVYTAATTFTDPMTGFDTRIPVYIDPKGRFSFQFTADPDAPTTHVLHVVEADTHIHARQKKVQGEMKRRLWKTLLRDLPEAREIRPLVIVDTKKHVDLIAEMIKELRLQHGFPVDWMPDLYQDAWQRLFSDAVPDYRTPQLNTRQSMNKQSHHALINVGDARIPIVTTINPKDESDGAPHFSITIHTSYGDKMRRAVGTMRTT